MSATARPALAIQSVPAARWAPWAIVAADVLAIEIAFLLGLCVRRLVAPWFPNGVGPEQYLGVAAGILLLPMVNYQLGLYPGYLLGPVERLRRRMLATLAVFGGLVAWDNLVARGVFSRGVLLATLLFVLVLPPLAETRGARDPDRARALGHSRGDARRGRYGTRGGPDLDSRAAAGAEADRVSG